jgi:hypothetical protein
MSKSVKVELNQGVQVLPLPEGQRNHWGDFEPVSEEETIALYNDFFGQIDAQGGEVIATFKKVVALPERGGVAGIPTEERLFLVVRK